MLKTASRDRLAENIKQLHGALHPNVAKFEVSADQESPIVVMRSKHDAYHQKLSQLVDLHTSLRAAGYETSLCRGTRIEKSSKYFPFLRIIVHASATTAQIEGLSRVINSA